MWQGRQFGNITFEEGFEEDFDVDKVRTLIEDEFRGDKANPKGYPFTSTKSSRSKIRRS